MRRIGSVARAIARSSSHTPPLFVQYALAPASIIAITTLLSARAGERDHARLGKQRTDSARRLDAAEDRHLDVHQHDVRRERDRELDRLLAVLGLTDDRDRG